MSRMDQIQAIVADDMAVFQAHFKTAMRTDVTLLDTITRYIIKRKGKQMRPLFVFLTASCVRNASNPREPLPQRSHVAASLIELLHTATLVHDDVVDESSTRRGFFSIQALWKKKIAVLVGDYLLSRGLLMAVDQEAYDLLKITSEAVKQMSEGELMQIEKARRLDITESIYFDIIQRKTASLIAACCACGAASVGASKEEIEKMRRFGELVGLAFQIKDDLLDLGDGERIGKPTGGDIRERKMTLPLIHTLNQASPQERRRLIRLVKYQHHKDEAVETVMKAIIDGPGMDYARVRMAEIRDEALEILNEMPDSPGRSGLIELVNFTIDRKR